MKFYAVHTIWAKSANSDRYLFPFKFTLQKHGKFCRSLYFSLWTSFLRTVTFYQFFDHQTELKLSHHFKFEFKIKSKFIIQSIKTITIVQKVTNFKTNLRNISKMKTAVSANNYALLWFCSTRHQTKSYHYQEM